MASAPPAATEAAGPVSLQLKSYREEPSPFLRGHPGDSPPDLREVRAAATARPGPGGPAARFAGREPRTAHVDTECGHAGIEAATAAGKESR
jgi:hypothetical protein